MISDKLQCLSRLSHLHSTRITRKSFIDKWHLASEWQIIKEWVKLAYGTIRYSFERNSEQQQNFQLRLFFESHQFECLLPTLAPITRVWFFWRNLTCSTECKMILRLKVPWVNLFWVKTVSTFTLNCNGYCRWYYFSIIHLAKLAGVNMISMWRKWNRNSRYLCIFYAF